jgi:hypothetical protein
LLQLRGTFSHQLHWLRLCQQVEALEKASCLPALQMVANFHKVAMPGKTYTVRTITKEMSLQLTTWLLKTRTPLPQECSRSQLVWGQLGRGVPRRVQTSPPPQIPKFWGSWAEIVFQDEKLRKF